MRYERLLKADDALRQNEDWLCKGVPEQFPRQTSSQHCQYEYLSLLRTMLAESVARTGG